MVRMLRRAQIDSSDGAAVRKWIDEYTRLLQAHGAGVVEVRAWTHAYGDYGRAYWTFDAADLATLDQYLAGLPRHTDLADVLIRGSSLFVSGMTNDMLLRELG